MTTADRPNRRDFLDGRAAAHALVDAVRQIGDMSTDIAPEDSTSPSGVAPFATDRGQLLTSIRRRAMACEFEVQLAAGADVQTTDHVLEALDLVESLEDQMTVYRTDSELITINREAAAGPMEVEPRLFALLQLAAELHAETNGALDITSGPLSDVWGFSRRQGRLPSDDEIAAALSRVGMDKIVLNDADCTVQFRQPGVSLHLNCIGKGYALDCMAELLATHHLENYLLHGGRSSVLARGRHPGSDREDWTIGIPHPLVPGERLAEIYLQNRALGTSGSGTQFFEHEGRRYGHLLDPRTGWPAVGIYSATAIAPTAATADALSTAFYIMGPAEVGHFCAARPEIAALLVCPADDDSGVQVLTFGLSPENWRPLAGS
jgi:thiamine biosynthesis lipoprotein